MNRNNFTTSMVYIRSGAAVKAKQEYIALKIVSAPIKTLRQRFYRSRTGSAAVEFAMLAPPFLALLFAILETGIMFFANQYLQTITQQGARMIFTGKAQTGNYTQAQFQSYICSQVVALFTCSNIYVDVESFSSFQAVTLSNQISNGSFANNMTYSPGGSGDVVVVRLFYKWPQIVTGLGYNITNLNGNYRLLMGTAAFKNEPF